MSRRFTYVLTFFISATSFGGGDHATVYGQRPPYLSQDRFMFTTGVDGKAVADPTSFLNNVSYLRVPSVVTELNLDEGQRQEIGALLAETRGVPSIIVQERDFRKPLRSYDERQLELAAIRLNRENRFKEILDPRQVDRLMQVAYHVEIARVGIGEAVINGHLGEAAGVQNFEKASLKIIYDSLMLDLGRAKSRVLKASTEKICSELSSESRRLLLKTTGEAFEYREDSMERLDRQSRESKYPKNRTNPEFILDLFALLENKSVREELGISEEQLKEIREVIRTALRLRTSNDRVSLEKQISFAISSDKCARLKQIGYQLEIMRFGLSSAIFEGFLGEAIGLSDSERQTLKVTLRPIDSATEQSLVLLNSAAVADFSKNLSPATRLKITELLGKSFSFRE